MNSPAGERTRRVLVIGGSLAGLQAALDLADAGIEVHLVDSSPFLGSSTTAPPRMNARWLEAHRHPNLNIWTNTTVNPKDAEAGCFRLELQQAARYVDLTRCTACGECIEACPVTVPGAQPRNAIYIDGQPGCAAIDKQGTAPCRAHCPINQRAQGYIALIRQGRFAEAYRTIKPENPFPSVCGRVCNHRCEDACSRGKYDEPVNIMGLKRFVADWAYAHRSMIEAGSSSPTPLHSPSRGERVAVIGAGPAGLTAALDLTRLGYTVTVFDALPLAGGMMRVGIPPHRLPDELLDWEIQQIVDEGVELRLNTWVDDIPALLEQGYQAVLIATGAHIAKKLSIRNSNHPNNWLSLDILRHARMLATEGQGLPWRDLSGKKIVVLGGGNVALDTARTVMRLGASEVRMACLEPRGEMPGFEWEVAVAEQEGIQMYPGRTFKEIAVQGDDIVGVRCVEIEFRGFKHGRPDFTEIPDSEHILPADIVVWAVGQAPNFSFLPQDGSINTRYPVGVQADEHMMTTMPGVFVAGDVRRGVTFFVVDAIAEGHIVARSIDCHLRGSPSWQPPQKPPVVTLAPEQIELKLSQGQASKSRRVAIRNVPLAGRTRSFQEVDLTLSEAEVLAEANRCLGCGVCSECLACVQVCKAGAVIHEQGQTFSKIEVGAVIQADGAEDLPWPLPAGWGYYHLSPGEALPGSAAAARVMAELGGVNTHQQFHSSFRYSVDSPARIGVFVCQCGGEISQVVNTAAVCERAAACPGVAYTQVLPFSCSPQAAEAIGEAVQTHDLNRIVLAACSCCALDQVCDSCTYQRLRCKDNMGVFPRTSSSQPPGTPALRFEFVNIREQCAWPHSSDPPAATAKAAAMVAAAVARGCLCSKVVPDAPQQSGTWPDFSVLILGSGDAGHTCQEVLSSAGIPLQRAAGKPQHIWRANGRYMAAEGNPGDVEGRVWQASALVLAPGNAAEAEQLLAAFGRQILQPRLRSPSCSVDTHRPGVYYCDFSADTELVGAAAAARAAAWLGRTSSRAEYDAAVVNPSLCRACSTCIDICEFGAPQLVGELPHAAVWIDPAVCAGCGVCAAHCPSGAITLPSSSIVQLEATLAALLEAP